MKKFIAILMVLLMIPLYCFAVDSPTAKKVITCKPELQFELADTVEEWKDVIKRIEDIKDETEGYILLDALIININEPCGKIEWSLSIPVTTEHEPFVLIIDSEAIVKQETSITEEGAIITDFTDYEPGTYWVCFYIKGA